MENNPFSLVLPQTPKSIPDLQSQKIFRQHQTNHPYSKKRIGQYCYYLKEFIGCGYSSQVYKCYKNNIKDKTYAVKVVNLNRLTRTEYSLLQNEISILKQLDHPNIIKFYDVHYTKNNAYIITDFCESGTLENYIRQSTQNFDNWKNILSQILQAFKYLTERLIIHRDIKPANIFLKQGVWKIGDFGFAVQLTTRNQILSQSFNVGSPLYMPPETLKHNIYSLKTDSFALGVTLFYLLTCQFPWPDNNSSQQILSAYQSKKFPIEKLSHIEEQAKNFVANLCQLNLSQRMFIDDFSSTTLDLILADQLTEMEKLEKNFTILLQFGIVQKIKLCKFLHYLQKNIQQYLQMREICQGIDRMLAYICRLLKEHGNASLRDYLKAFESDTIQKQQIDQNYVDSLIKNIENKLKQLAWRRISIYEIISTKLQQFLRILKLIMDHKQNQLRQLISEMVLQPVFSQLITKRK